MKKLECLKKEAVDAKMENCLKQKKWEEGMAIKLFCI
jgi:hypothetical protein